jgi:site-specific DNA-methyltransferase (adenine-specific)
MILETNKIYLGNTLEVLKTFPNESVNCCITSPPYWALRDYKLEPQIWDTKEGCEHDFELVERKDPQDRNGSGDHDSGGIAKSWSKEPNITGFCSKCGAWKGSLGLEPTFELYIKHLCDIYDEIKRVLRKDGTCWVNLGDTYSTKSGSGFANDNLNPLTPEQIAERTGIYEANKLRGNWKDKCLCMIPFRFAIEMVNRGWILRNVIVWHKPNCMPCSVKDRFTVDFEYVFFFVKSKKYWFETQYEPLSDVTIKDITNRKNLACLTGEHNSKHFDNPDSVFDQQKTGRLRTEFVNLEKGRNKRAVWSICPQPFRESHFAVFPEALVEPMIKSGCQKDGLVLDIFLGSGTTAVVAKKLGRNWIGIELNPKYVEMAQKRIDGFTFDDFRHERENHSLEKWIKNE